MLLLRNRIDRLVISWRRVTTIRITSKRMCSRVHRSRHRLAWRWIVFTGVLLGIHLGRWRASIVMTSSVMSFMHWRFSRILL